ncbi:DUF551 domain-containing protein [Salmonella enterica]|nr:DUF551 domain-containing protein [Salmonella enterica subsp. enterica serovar Tucson]EDR6858024.1 DUF551 domain-containing protein [Salmonella enterica subsp. enterica]EIK1667335.1 DUF551 domain-containing protein [Salmonella enterica]EDU3652864.1 DUF551 domain-containing protein [Salmonella enterica subsp. enterica serovar Tucson]EEC0798929.1 DUF551 domain-containing protein [Salmonella enterica subsp. enterica]
MKERGITDGLTPDGWISCSERMPDNDESIRGYF